MISLDFLDHFDEKLAHLHGRSSEHRSKDFVVPSQERNAMMIHEQDGDVDLAIFLKTELLSKYQDFELSNDFSLEHFSDLSILVEELSHFKTYCDHAERNLELSRLSLEVQAEIDKFAFALDCLEERNFKALRYKVFESLFDDLQLGDWVKEEDKSLYETAHRVAKNHCRDLLKTSSNLRSLIESVRHFTRKNFQDKHRYTL